MCSVPNKSKWNAWGTHGENMFVLDSYKQARATTPFFILHGSIPESTAGLWVNPSHTARDERTMHRCRTEMPGKPRLQLGAMCSGLSAVFGNLRGAL